MKYVNDCQRDCLVMLGVPAAVVDDVVSVVNEMTRRAVYRAVTLDRRHKNLDIQLKEAGARNVKAVKSLLDMSKIKIDRYSGEIRGLEWQINQLKISKDSYFLFNTTKEELAELIASEIKFRAALQRFR
jgi:hypothetical protein